MKTRYTGPCIHSEAQKVSLVTNLSGSVLVIKEGLLIGFKVKKTGEKESVDCS